MQIIKGHIIDVIHRKQFKGCITINNGFISNIEPCEDVPNHFILPGFIDAHIHIESSMLIPSNFAKVAVRHGTVATVSDPHEIANVCGMDGINFMIEDGLKTPLKFHFGAPSCVPATIFETSGATIDVNNIKQLMSQETIYYLSEVMNYPGVINEDNEIMQKILAAKAASKPIDGHAPGMLFPETDHYFSKGITTDHECFTIEEALDKLMCGAKIIIREGSAAKNFDALIPLINDYPDNIMFCSDDKHPDDLLAGHINKLVQRAVAQGYNLYDVLYAACIQPIDHYHLPVGKLQIGDAADLVIVDNLDLFNVKSTYINGQCVYDDGTIHFDFINDKIINHFNCSPKLVNEFKIATKYPERNTTLVNVIEVLDGQLVTQKSQVSLNITDGFIQPDLEKDCLIVAVINRYADNPIALGFIKHFGLKNCAIASSVAHDSHNIIAVGSDPLYLSQAVNAIIQSKGGISFASSDDLDVLPLSIGGIMTNASPESVASSYQRLTRKAKQSGSQLKAPYMTLSFMALPVIPALKMTDKGLFDVSHFNFLRLEI